MKHEDVVAFFGSAKAVCEALNVSKTLVSRWRHRRIPDAHQASIFSISRGKVKPDRDAMKWIKRKFPNGLSSA